MLRLFTDRIQGLWVVVWAIAPLVWGAAAFQLSGSWQALGEAQSGVPGEAFWLQATPGFTPEQAQAAFSNLRAAGAEGVALTAYLLDLVFIVLNTLGLGALIGFGLRRLDWAHGPLALVLLAPIVFFAADMVETLALLAALTLELDGSAALMTVAGAATAVKLPAVFASYALAMAAMLAGLATWAFKRANKALGPQG